MLPAYLQIHDQIKKEIDEEVWQIGQRLPSERDLAETFQVSRMTLRQAITLLVEEGVLERRVGSGTFVASTRVQEKMRGTTSFTEIMKSQGKTPSSQLISYRRTLPSKQEVEKLGINKTENIKISAKKMKKLILSSRFIEDDNSKFFLQLTYSNKSLTFKLTDKNGYTLYSKNFPIEKLDKNGFKNSVNIFVKDIFTFKL